MLVEASSGRLDVAELERELSRHPRPAEASRQLARYYELAGNLEGAERLLRSATVLDPQDWFNWHWLGTFLLRHRRPPQALEAIETAARLAPPAVWQPKAQLGAVALRQGRIEDAIAILESLPGSAGDAAVASNLGTAYFYSKRPDKWERAEESYRTAVRLSPNRAEYHGNLADLESRLGRTAQAVAGYRRALELSRAEIDANPGDFEAQLSTAVYAAKAEECPAALEQARAMWSRRPDSSGELHNIALVFSLCRERDQALEALAAAVDRGYAAEPLREESEFEWLREDPRFPRAQPAPSAARQK
jgi:tetratricopeptide (TPR) repeat protein